ncbi:MAG: hypothetical protein NZ840_11910 [Anaerolineales bacterium]|nr:hypothetical protein [Anaerolineales bacterium]MDW8162740.1 hypothetical protein [Anaerolineales bacterium]
MSAINLDQLCAKYGWQIACELHQAIRKQSENHITQSLGVLQENGVYAFFLYQASQGLQGKVSFYKLLEEAGIQSFQNVSDPLAAVRDHLANHLDQLLFAKRLLEQALIYARYHAKALE